MEKRGVNADDFIIFLTKLLPDLKPSSVIYLDNAAIHKTARVEQWFADHGINVFYSSPYSPDYNPIELLFSQLKQIVKRDRYQNWPLIAVIERKMKSFLSITLIM
ncbi:TCB1 [Acrasis kona]|uniref:TCB1 n=1 Tax=Acrasis kona TaxID=1008807 RepID=A0AAW2YL77_9EUKA